MTWYTVARRREEEENKQKRRDRYMNGGWCETNQVEDAAEKEGAEKIAMPVGPTMVENERVW